MKSPPRLLLPKMFMVLAGLVYTHASTNATTDGAEVDATDGAEVDAKLVAAIWAAVMGNVIGALLSGFACFYGMMRVMKEFGVFENLGGSSGSTVPQPSVVVHATQATPSHKAAVDDRIFAPVGQP